MIRKYYFINKFDTNNIDKQDKQTAIIYRNYSKKTSDQTLILKIKRYCKKKYIKFYLSNNIKLAIKLDLDGVYIPSFNKSTGHLSYSLKKNFQILGSAHNLKEINSARNNDYEGNAYYQKLFNKCSILMQAIVNCPKPIIAEIDGVATAAGCQLVASCDLAVASENASFMTPGVNIGLFCSTPMVAGSRNISRKKIMEMLLTGDMISADRAEEIGLINRSTPMKDLEATVTSIAKKIASTSSLTVKTGKKTSYAQKEMDLAQAYKHTSKVMVENLFYEDAKEGISACLEKRDPDWNDR